jgi:uncharacterized repeat protein (TIGR03803 family)
MKLRVKNPFLLPILLAGLVLILAGRVTAQVFTTLHSFTASSTNSSGFYTNSDGVGPSVGLIVSNKTFYGTTGGGGSGGNGTIFMMNRDGTGFTNLYSLAAGSGSFPNVINSDGANPYGLILSGNTLYGVTTYGGTNGNGTVFRVNTDGVGFTNLHNFTVTSNSKIIPSAYTNIDGANPHAGLVLSGKTLYGTARLGGNSGKGIVFALNTDGTGFTNLHNFSATSTAGPGGIPNVNRDGAFPAGGLILSGNTLYGVTAYGGMGGNGTVFAINIDGTGFTNLHSFSFGSYPTRNSDGANPSAALILSSNTLYGTASSGGRSSEGTVFAVNTDGTGFTNLHSFTGTFINDFPYAGSDGGVPVGELVLSGNTLYGTAQYGGYTNYPSEGSGTVFAVNTDGTGFTTLYRFTPISTNLPYGNSDGAFPGGRLILSSNTLYGTAGGGSSDSGTIFSLPVTSRPMSQFPPIFAGFTTATIQTANMTITPTAYFSYNTNFPGSWDIAAESFGFTGTFDVPSTGTYMLTANHQTSAATSCPGGGYSPVNVYVNGTQIASNFDPAQQSGGSLGEVTNSWLITATAGVDNTLKWAAGPLCSRYWIEALQITPMPLPVLTILPAAADVILAWPTNVTGFMLQSTTNLGSSAVWTTNSPAPAVFNGQNTATNPISGIQRFYRLSQ